MGRNRQLRCELTGLLDDFQNISDGKRGECIRRMVELMQELGVYDGNPLLERYNVLFANGSKVTRGPEMIKTPGQGEVVPDAVYLPGQSKFMGRVQGTMVCVTKLSEVVIVSETYRGQFRIGWAFGRLDANPAFIEIYRIPTNRSEIFAKYSRDFLDFDSSRISSSELGMIDSDMPLRTSKEQVQGFVNFGFGLCKRIVDGIGRGDFTSYPGNPLSNLPTHNRGADAWWVVTSNRNRSLELLEERRVGARSLYTYRMT